jgi:lysozyme
MKSAGVLRGAYQFFEPSEDEVAQANLMVQKVGKLGPGDLPAMIDVEVTDGQGGGTIGAKVAHWLQIVEAGTGRKPIIYSGSYFWQDDVGDTGLGSYPIWIAAYGPACPSLPPGWSSWRRSWESAADRSRRARSWREEDERRRSAVLAEDERDRRRGVVGAEGGAAGYSIS